jgi:hypothetical protein
MKKSLTQDDLVEEIKDMLEDAVEPFDTVVEIDDDEEIKKALRPEITKEQLGMVIEHLMEAIEGMIEMPEVETETDTEAPESEDSTEMEDMSKSDIYKSDDEEDDKWDNEMQKCWTGYRQVGMKEKNGRMVPNCVPVDKAYDVEDKEEPVKKSIWDGTFIK